MRIALSLKAPFTGIFGVEETEVDVPEGSTIQRAIETLIEKYDMMDTLVEKRLFGEGELKALYAINKHIKGGSIVKGDRVLEESDRLTVLGTFIGG